MNLFMSPPASFYAFQQDTGPPEHHLNSDSADHNMENNHFGYLNGNSNNQNPTQSADLSTSIPSSFASPTFAPGVSTTSTMSTPNFPSMQSPFDSIMEGRSMFSPPQFFRRPLSASTSNASGGQSIEEASANAIPSFSLSMASGSTSALPSLSSANADPSTASSSHLSVNTNSATSSTPLLNPPYGVSSSPLNIPWSLPSPSFSFFSPSPKTRQSPRLLHRPPEYSGLLYSPLARKRRASIALLSSPNWNYQGSSPQWESSIPYSHIPVLPPEFIGAGEDETSSAGSTVVSPAGGSAISSVTTSPSSVRTSPLLSMASLSPRNFCSHLLPSPASYYQPTRRLPTAVLPPGTNHLDSFVKKEASIIPPSFTNLPTLESLTNIVDNKANSNSSSPSIGSLSSSENLSVNNPDTGSDSQLLDPKRASGVSCHQCKTRRSSADLYKCCKQHPKKGRRKRKKERFCRKKYCDRCLFKFYGESMPPPQIVNANNANGNGATETNGSTTTNPTLSSNGLNWICPSCRGLCTCAACKRHIRKTERERERSERERKSKVTSRLNARRYEPYAALQATPANTVIATVPTPNAKVVMSSKVH